MFKKILFSIFVMALCLTPLTANVALGEIDIDIDNTQDTTRTYRYGGGGVGSGHFTDLVENVLDIIGNVIILLIAIAVLVFIIGVLKYIAKGDDEEERKKGRSLMIYGIISLFVIVSVWGLVNVLVYTFDLDNDYPSDIPYLEQSGGGSGSGGSGDGGNDPVNI